MKKKTDKKVGKVPEAINFIGQRITSGEYAIDKQLPIENNLVSEIGVGRNSLREAIKALSGKGMLVSERRRGTFVTPKSSWNILDPDVLNWYVNLSPIPEDLFESLMEIRMILEPEAAKIAAKRATREEIAVIMSACERMGDLTNSPEEYVIADVEFHGAILNATHNIIMTAFRHALDTLLKASFDKIVEQSPKAATDNHSRHRELAIAIASGDSEKAFIISKKLLFQTESVISDLD